MASNVHDFNDRSIHIVADGKPRAFVRRKTDRRFMHVQRAEDLRFQ